MLNRIAGHMKGLDEFMQVHQRPSAANAAGLCDLVNEAQPLEIWVDIGTLRQMVEANTANLRTTITQGQDTYEEGPEREINAALLQQREQFLRVLKNYPDEHVFCSIYPIENPFDEGEDPDAEPAF